MTAQQRAVASTKASAARQHRAQIRAQLKSGGISVADVLAAASSDDALAKLRVITLLESLPGIGRTKASAILARNGIADSRRLRGLGPHQRDALLSELG